MQEARGELSLIRTRTLLATVESIGNIGNTTTVLKRHGFFPTRSLGPLHDFLVK